MSNASGLAMKLRAIPPGRQTGEMARFRVLKGPDRGAIYIIKTARVSIGRGEENEVRIADLKASRLHAEVISTSSGWSIKDLGSANGILLNGKNSRSGLLKTGDLVTVGESVLEFLGSDADLNQLRLVPQDEQSVDKFLNSKEKAKEVRERNLSDPFGLKVKLAKPGGPVNNTKKIINLSIVAALVIGIIIFWDQIFPTPIRKEKKKTDALKVESPGPQDLESLLPKLQKRPTSKSSEMFFRQGFREYREKNYFRALGQFELVLQIDPNHEMARRYRDNAQRAIKEDVELNLERGKNSWKAGKLRQAKSHFEAVIRLLEKDKKNPAYIEATDQLERLKTELEAD